MSSRVQFWGGVQFVVGLIALYFIGATIVRLIIWDWPGVQVRLTIVLGLLLVMVWARRRMWRAQRDLDRS